VTGVGFAAEGMDRSHPFRRLAASHDADVAWIFDGVDGEVFGDHGLAHGGAAGIEIDRYDRRFGTPAHTRLLATSDGYSDGYPLVIEEVLTNVSGLAGTSSPFVRGDVTYTTNAAGGAVFCTGSIAWGQALPTGGYDNDIARITGNVVARFAAADPLPHLGDPLDDQQAPIVDAWRARYDHGLAESPLSTTVLCWPNSQRPRSGRARTACSGSSTPPAAATTASSSTRSSRSSGMRSSTAVWRWRTSIPWRLRWSPRSNDGSLERALPA
jgi:hypothetical protein